MTLSVHPENSNYNDNNKNNKNLITMEACMSNTRNPHTPDTVKPNATRNLALSTTALAVVIFASPALAIDYSYGEVSGSIDTFISAGASMRTSARDCRNLGARQRRLQDSGHFRR